MSPASARPSVAGTDCPELRLPPLARVSRSGFGDRAPEGLSKREKEELIAEWEPQPLLPAVAEHDRAYEGEERVVKSSDGLRMELQCGDGETRTVTNFSSFDFLGLSADAVVRKAASDTMEKYTFGSCGPRGFYGTFDKHLEVRRFAPTSTGG